MYLNKCENKNEIEEKSNLTFNLSSKAHEWECKPSDT